MSSSVLVTGGGAGIGAAVALAAAERWASVAALDVDGERASAIAAEATRGVNPGTPATMPLVIEPETSRPSTHRLPVGSTLPNAA